jgi:small subunit ribosomal protein S8
MSMNDLLSDLLARLRNGQSANLSVVRAPASKLSESVLKVLEEEGYIESVTRETVSKGRDELVITLKYHEGKPVIQKMRRVSTPGRRVYRQITAMPRVQNGLGISILSTSKGVMSDFAARQANVGGEVLCNVF